MRNNKPELTQLAVLAAKRQNYIASLLETYKEFKQINNEQLSFFLECNISMLPRLALCRRPRPFPHFQRDITRIAEYISINPDKLIQLIISIDNSLEDN